MVAEPSSDMEMQTIYDYSLNSQSKMAPILFKKLSEEIDIESSTSSGISESIPYQEISIPQEALEEENIIFVQDKNGDWIMDHSELELIIKKTKEIPLEETENYLKHWRKIRQELLEIKGGVSNTLREYAGDDDGFYLR